MKIEALTPLFSGAVSAAITFIATNWYNRRSNKVCFEDKLLEKYEDIASKYLDLHEKYNKLAEELNNLKDENNKLKQIINEMNKDLHNDLHTNTQTI